MRSKTIVVFMISAFIAIPLTAQTRPFPQAGLFQMGGAVIKPNDRNQNDLNNDVIAKYNNYKTRYLKQASGGKYYILATGNGKVDCGNTQTISEAHGYGMIIFALMAGYDNEAKTIFNGMNALRKAQKSSSNSSLMSWVVCDVNANSATPDDAATDGDLDNAYALLLAYRQWGDQSYLTDAQNLIGAIKQSEMSGQTKRTKLGDWSSSHYNTRSSDWMPGHFRAFREATNDDFWREAADTVYKLLGQVSNQTTGLMPDFVTGTNPVPDADGGGTHEDNAQHYSYNACRVPWRIATDYAHHGTPAAKTQIDKISAWLKTATNGQPNQIKDGYQLNGTALGGYNALEFTAPFASGMIANSANQTFLNSIYNAIRANNPGNGDEYGAGIQLLNMLLISGNWWAPYSSGGTNPPNPPEPPVTIDCESVDITKWEADSWGEDKDGASSVNYSVAGGKVNFTFNRAREQGNNYTWTEIYCGFDKGDFTNVDSITITYKSDKQINIVLGDEALSGEGEGYYSELAASSSPKTVTIKTSSFIQPDWADYSPNNKSQVESIIIEANTDNTTTTGEITKLELHCFGGGNTPITFGKVKHKQKVGGAGITVSQRNVNLNIPSEKFVTIKISDVRGRLLYGKDVTLNSGTASLDIPRSINGKQTLILNVTGKNGFNVSKKMILK